MSKTVKRLLAASGAVLVAVGFGCSVVLRCSAFAFPIVQGLGLAIGLMLLYCGYVGACNENGWSDNTVIENLKNSYLGSGAYAEDWLSGTEEIGNWLSNIGGFCQNLVGSWNEIYSPSDLQSWNEYGGEVTYDFPGGLLYTVEPGFCVQLNRPDFVGNVSNVKMTSNNYPYFNLAGLNTTNQYVFAFVNNEFSSYSVNTLTQEISRANYYLIYIDSRGSASYRNLRSPILQSQFPLSVYDNGSTFDYSYAEFQQFVSALGATYNFDSVEELQEVVFAYFGGGVVGEDVSENSGVYPAKYAFPAAETLGENADYLGGIQLDAENLTEEDLQAGLDAVGVSSVDDFYMGLHTGALTPADVYISMQAAGVTPYVLTDATTGEVITDRAAAVGQTGVKAVALDSSLAVPSASAAVAAPEYMPQNFSLVNPGHFQYPLFDYFPWCLPKDIYLIFNDFLVAAPIVPVVDLPLVLPNGETEHIIISLAELDPIMVVVRKFEVLAFCVGVVLFVKKVIH